MILLQEQPPSGSQRTPGPKVLYRHEVINALQRNHALVILIADNLTQVGGFPDHYVTMAGFFI